MIESFPRIQLDDIRTAHPGLFDAAEHVGVGTGWLPIVESFIADVAGLPVEILELKEKMGGLRMWTEATADMPPETRRMVALEAVIAEERSKHVCEVCGRVGRIRQPPPKTMPFRWLTARCDDHADPDTKDWSSPKPALRQWIGEFFTYDVATDTLQPATPPERWRRT